MLLHIPVNRERVFQQGLIKYSFQVIACANAYEHQPHIASLPPSTARPEPSLNSPLISLVN
jgi:hypothetical protein